MKRKLVAVVVVVAVAVVAVVALVLLSSGNQPPDGEPPSDSIPSEAPSKTTSETPSPNPSLNVRIDYIGVKNAGGQDDLLPDDSDGEVQLVVVVADGKTTTPEDQVYIPLTKQGYKMGDFEAIEINQRVFHTSSVGDYIKVSIIAYDVDSKTQTLNLLSELEMLGAPGAAQLRVIIELLPQEDDLIGCYQRTWHKDEDWGIGQYREVAQNTFANDNFLVGISFWSEGEPPAIPTPTLLPDVKIQNADMPSHVKQSNSGWFYWEWYTNTLTLVNNEPIDVKVDWRAYSSAKGEFDHGTAIVPADGKCDISRSYFYENDVGPLELTYTVSHNGRELDSWSGTMNVIPGPYS